MMVVPNPPSLTARPPPNMQLAMTTHPEVDSTSETKRQIFNQYTSAFVQNNLIAAFSL